MHKRLHKTIPNGMNLPELLRWLPNYLVESEQEGRGERWLCMLSGTKGRRFESCQARHSFNDLALIDILWNTICDVVCVVNTLCIPLHGRFC